MRKRQTTGVAQSSADRFIELIGAARSRASCVVSSGGAPASSPGVVFEPSTAGVFGHLGAKGKTRYRTPVSVSSFVRQLPKTISNSFGRAAFN
jgi:hypothetical protein